MINSDSLILVAFLLHLGNPPMTGTMDHCSKINAHFIHSMQNIEQFNPSFIRNIGDNSYILTFADPKFGGRVYKEMVESKLVDRATCMG